MNRFKKNLVTCARILSNGLWWRTGSKKWPWPILTKTKNLILMTIATPVVLFFPFITTHPKQKIWENLHDFWIEGKHPQKTSDFIENPIITSYHRTISYHRGFKLQSSKYGFSFFFFFFLEETSSLHFYLFFFFFFFLQANLENMNWHNYVYALPSSISAYLLIMRNWWY